MSEFQQIFNGLMTGLLLIIFIGICLWSWSSKRKDSFDQMAHLPLEDGGMPNKDHELNIETSDIKDKREASL
jgi:cytochrome c oxidase cbb3-type subunit 4